MIIMSEEEEEEGQGAKGVVEACVSCALAERRFEEEESMERVVCSTCRASVHLCCAGLETREQAPGFQCEVCRMEAA